MKIRSKLVSAGSRERERARGKERKTSLTCKHAPGAPFEIRGVGDELLGTIKLNYSLHVIPTVGFVARCQGKSICYSGDTCTNPKLVEKMYKDEIIGEDRFNELYNFTNTFKDHDIILHEMGVPPIQ